MDIFFNDPNDAPVPPEDVRIRKLEAQFWPDGKRVAVRFSVTPFLKRPNIELKLLTNNEEELAELNVVEALDTEMEFTMHPRNQSADGEYKLKMRVFYSDLDSIDGTDKQEDSAGEILEEVAFTSDISEITLTLDSSN